MAHALREAYNLLLPQWGVVALALWSHKVLRLFGFWMLVAAMTGPIWLLEYPIYRWLFAIQAVVYGAALCAEQLRMVPLVGRCAAAVRYCVVLHAALALGGLKVLLGMAQPIWVPTQRSEENLMRSEVRSDRKLSQRQKRKSLLGKSGI